MKIYTKEKLIEELIKIRNQGWVLSRRKNNDGGVGNTLEDLLGIDENNLPIPNAAEWELKAQRKETTSLVTLFHMEPSPRALKFVPSLLLPNFGWKHKEAGLKYSIDEKSFRQTINARSFSDRGFSVMVDRINNRISVLFDYNNIDKKKHLHWYQQVMGNELEILPYWGFDDVFHKLGSKLHNCFFVRAKVKKENGNLYFWYQDIFMLKSLDKNKFINLIEDGKIYIDFDARTGHNHGTKFRLQNQFLPNLYEEVAEY